MAKAKVRFRLHRRLLIIATVCHSWSVRIARTHTAELMLLMAPLLHINIAQCVFMDADWRGESAKEPIVLSEWIQTPKMAV